MTKSGSKPKRPPSPRQRCRYTGVGLTLHCSEDSTSPKAKRVKETRLREQRARVKDFTPIAPATRLASADAYKMAMDHLLDDTSGHTASPDPTLLPPPKFNKAKNSKLSPYARHELDQLLYLSGELGLSSAEVSKRMPGRTEGALSQMWAMGHEWDSYGKSRRLFSAEEDAVIMSLKVRRSITPAIRTHSSARLTFVSRLKALRSERSQSSYRVAMLGAFSGAGIVT